jgi:metal-responsive CopG/Arc/MetJ family transcriptional regulator
MAPMPAMFEKADRAPALVTTISLPRSLVERIDDFRFERHLSSRGEAIRQLIEAGLWRAKETKPGSSS